MKMRYNRGSKIYLKGDRSYGKGIAGRIIGK